MSVTDGGIKRRLCALAAALAMVVCATPRAAAQTAMPEGIPDFSQDVSRPSVQTVQSGSWSSPSTWQGGVVPTSNHIVRILQAHTVTIQNQAATAYTVSVDGKLAFDPTVNTRLYVTNLQVMAGNMGMGTPGVLEVGTVANPIAAGRTAEIVIANNPLGGSVADVDQFGTGITVLGKVSMHGSVKSPTFVRLAAEPRAGQSTLTLVDAASGWAVGDRLILPDTRHMKFNEVNDPSWTNKINQWEELTVAAISPDGKTITLSASLVYDHLGARDLNNVLEFLPHVGNISRNVIIRSESATGTRGHMLATHMADADIRYALFKDLGRTTYLPLNATTNHIGRYPVHMHHLIGPTVTPANGYQFTLVGNAVDGGSVETQFKWGITVHGSHYGSIKDNVVYNYNGAAIATEDGSESFNEFDHNFVMRGIGEPDEPGVQARMAMGTEGVGFWFRGPNNFVRNNVAANYQNPTTEAAYGFVFQFIGLGNVVVPTFKGADTLGMHGPVQGTLVNGNNLPLLEFNNNEAYGAMQGGLTYWWLGSLDPQPQTGVAESVIRNFKAWHTYNKTVYIYPGQKVTFEGLKIRGKFDAASHCCGDGVWFEDYSTKDTIIRNADIQGMEDGIQAPSSGFGPGPNLLVENSYLRNWRNINVPTPSSVNGCWMEDKLVTVSNTRFEAPPGRSLSAINMVGKANGVECLTKLNEVRVYAYNGDAVDNFQIYHPNASVLPRPPLGCTTAAVAGVNGLLNPTTLVSAPTCSIAPLVTASSITSPASGSTLTSDTQLFQWTTGSSVTGYQLFIGTFEGGTDVYAGPPTTDTSVTVTGLPTHGGVVWARLYSNIAGAWQYVDASYTAAGVPLFIDLAPSNMVSVEGVEAVTTAPFNAAKNDLLVAFVASSGPGAAGQTMTVSGGGLAWTLVKRANSQFGVAEIWKATAAVDLTGITVTSTPTQSSPSQSLVVLNFAGTGGIGASAAASGAIGAPSVSLTATKTGSFVYGVGNDWNGSVSRTVGTNQSIVHEYLGPNGDTFWVQRLNGTVPLIGTLITLNDSAPTDHSWNFAAIEIIPMQRIPPPITWPTPADIVYGAALDDAQLNATTEVAGTFVYTPPAGTVLNAGANQTLSVTFTPANSTTIYGPATATVSLNVLKAPSFVTWLNPADITYGTALSASQLNATANLPGTFVYSPPVGTILSAGNSQPLSVTFTPDDANYQTVTTAVMINVTATTPAVTWNPPMAIVYGTALSGTQLNASAGVPGTFVYTPAAGAVLAAGARTLSVTFTPTDTAFAPSTKTVPLTVLKATPVISWATPANIVAGTALSATQLNATVATPPGTLVYSPAAGTVLAAGPSQRLAVTFTPTDTANYNVASAAVPITVISAAVASPVKIGTTIGGTFSDATGHSGQSHLVFAPNANVWWLFTLSSAHDTLGDRTVQSYVSSGPDLATATWSAKAVSPTLTNVGGATSSVLAGGRSLGVAVRSIGGVDYAHVFVSAAFDGQTSSNGHARATLGATTISWGAWNNPGSPNTASEWQGPLNSGNPPSAASTHTSWGNSIGISTGGFIHHFSVTLDQEVDCAVGRSTNADVSASWTNGFGTNTSPTGLAGTSPPWTVAVIDKTMTNECKAMSFAPLASDFMLAVYSNGAVVQPNLTNLRYQKSGASGTWTNISASTGGGSGNVFSSTATINQNDWALVPVNTTTIHAYRRKATGTGIDAATYNVAGNSFAASAVQPPAFGTGQAFKAGGGLFGATDGTNVWLFVINTDTANSILYTQWNGTSWTAWATVPGTGVGSQTRNYITGNPTIGSGQAGLAWTQTNGSNFDVYATSFRTATAAPPATASITAPANLSTVAATVNVTANATPGGGTIAGVQFLLDGANLGAEDTVSPYSVSWDTTAVTNGTHFLTAVARDTNGGTGTATTVSVTVANDLTAPTVAMTAPANGSSVSGANVSVAAEALDDIGVVGVQFLLDGANLGAEDTVAPYIISWNASTASAGTHTLSARARDGFGRQTTSATVSVTVSSATPSITWPPPANIVYGTALSSTQLNASSSVPGTFAYTPPAGTVLPAGASQTLSVTFTPTDTTAYSTATSTTTITVTKATPSLTWATPAPIVYGTVLTATQLNATTGVAGTFAYTPVAGTVLAAGAGQTLSVTFTPTDTANYTNATASVAITVSKATPAITWPTPASIVYGTTLSSTQLNATTSVPGTFAYTPVAGTVLPAGAGQTLSTTFTPTDPSNYTTATASVAITVTKATPSITWPSPANIVYGTALGATQLNATTSVPGTFAYTPAAGTVLAVGAAQTLSTTFTPTDLTNYTTATATRTITVTKATPSITWPAPASIVYGTALGAAQLNATTSVPGTFAYTPAAGTVLAAGAGQNLSVTFTPTDAANYTTATASVSLTVLKASPVLTWPTPASIVYGTALGAAQLNATADVGGTFVYTPAAGAVLDAGSQTLSVTFTPTSANYSNATTTVTLPVTPALPVLALTGGHFTYDTVAHPATGTATGAGGASVAGSFAFTYTPGGAAAPVNAGSYGVTATFTSSDPNYSGGNATATVTIDPAATTVTWATPADIVYGTALGASQLNATAPVPGTFVYSPLTGAQLNAGNAQVLSVTFTPTSSNYLAQTKTVSINVLKASPVVTWTNPADITVSTALSGAQLNATANVPGAFAYTPAAGTVLAVGNQTLSTTFTPTDSGNYTSVPKSVTVRVRGLPSIAASATSVTVGAIVTATALDGPANKTDWIALYPAGGATYLDWKYMNGTQTAPAAGLADAIVPFAMPMTAGSYELRFFSGSTLLATSAAITVSGPTLSLSASTVIVGASVNATVGNGPGNARDWVGVYSADGSTLFDWKYLNGSQTVPATGVSNAVVSLAMPTLAGVYSVRLYANGAQLASAGITVTAASSPTLTASATTVAPGTVVTATAANGPANPRDWIALSLASDVNNYLDWKYLNGTQTVPATGVSGAAVPFTMPAAAGTYVLRFYTGSTLLASSAPITVAMPSTSLTVNTTTVSPGGTVSATVVNGPGGRTDWIALYPEGSSTYLDWRYLNGTQTAPATGLSSAVVDIPLPTTLGNYTLKLYTGSLLIATSATVTVSSGSSINLSATTVAPGGTVSATVLNGSGNKFDWVGLFVGNTGTYVDWKYLNGTQVVPATGLTTATVSLSIPAVQGTYTVRLMNGSTLLAVSPTITAGFAATMTLSATTVAPGESVTATVANGPGLQRDWIGLYQNGSSTLLDWKYLNGSQTLPASGVSSAAVAFPMPTTPGSYVLRFASGSTILATRSITVQ